MIDNQETINTSHMQSEYLSRAQGCLIGQLSGDALGSSARMAIGFRLSAFGKEGHKR